MDITRSLVLSHTNKEEYGRKHLSFSELNSIESTESIEFVENYF